MNTPIPQSTTPTRVIYAYPVISFLGHLWTVHITKPSSLTDPTEIFIRTMDGREFMNFNYKTRPLPGSFKGQAVIKNFGSMHGILEALVEAELVLDTSALLELDTKRVYNIVKLLPAIEPVIISQVMQEPERSELATKPQH